MYNCNENYCNLYLYASIIPNSTDPQNHSTVKAVEIIENKKEINKDE